MNAFCVNSSGSSLFAKYPVQGFRHFIWAQSVTCLATDAGLTADPGVTRKNVHEVLVNCLFKLSQEKVWLGELTIQP